MYKKRKSKRTTIRKVACEQALLFGRVKRVSRERGPSLVRSREARFACPNRGACSQAIRKGAINCDTF